ncbi:MAG: undecaprenyl-diphosphate phosphatase [Acidimicrobiales bacterium]
MNFLQAIVIGAIQGISELFPISSLGHTVLIPSWIGGTWATLVRQESLSESPYLAFVVGLHLATGVVLVSFYIREWARVVIGIIRSLVRRRIETDAERLGWLIVIATVPVGILGLLLEHQFRVLFAKPAASAIFLTINGLILFAGETYRRRGKHSRGLAGSAGLAGPAGLTGSGMRLGGAPERRSFGPPLKGSQFRDDRIVPMDSEAERTLSRIGVTSAFFIGLSQVLALLAGISREGVTMVGGLYRGLSNTDAMRFSFLLSTPVIFAAGALKVPDLLGPYGDGIRAQVVAGSLAAVATSIFAVVFLSRYFKTRTLRPFAIYSVLFGVASIIRFAVF